MAYVYHFCASAQSSPGQVGYYSGIAICTAEIESHERYDELRENIAQQSGFAVDSLTVNSLTFLHEAEEPHP